MAPDSRIALLLQIEAEALRVAARARSLREGGDGRAATPERIRGLCAWLYRLRCELVMVVSGDRPPKIYPPIETEALGYSADQARGWRWVEAVKRAGRFLFRLVALNKYL